MDFKDKKGSISIFVLVALLFMSAFLIIAYANNVNKSKTANEQFNIISSIYSYTNGDEGAYDKAYTDLRNKNKQTMNASSETASIELTKTYADKMSNLRIYGNSIQDGTSTPDTPIAVESVGNMVNIFDTSKTYGGWINHQEGGYSYEESSSYGTAFLEVKPNTSYCYSADISDVNLGVLSINLLYNVVDPTKYVDGNVLSIDKQVFVTGGKCETAKFTTDENTKMVAISYYRFNDIPKNIQLEEGTTSTEYVPYGKYRVTVKTSGKNLVSELVGGYTNSTNFPQIDAGGSKVFKTVILKNMKAGTYTFSFEKPINVVRSVSASSHDSFTAVQPSANSNTKVVTITLTQDEEEYHLSFRDTTSGTTEWNGWVQCEKGSVATEYEQYKGKTFNIYLDEPLRKLGEYVDYIDFKTGKVVRNIGHSVLSDDNITWTAYGNSQEDVLGFYSGKLPEGLNGSKYYALSNRFERTDTDIAPGTLSVNYETFYFNGSYLKIAISKRRVSDKDTFKTWLDQNPTYIEYILAKPTEENISLPELNTYEDYTKIEILTDVVPSKIEAEYTGYYINDNIFNKNKAIRLNSYITTSNTLKYSSDSITYMIKCSPNTEYTISHSSTDNSIFRVGYVTVQKDEFPNASGESISIFNAYRGTTEQSLILSTGSDATYIAVQIASAQADTTTKTLSVKVNTK